MNELMRGGYAGDACEMSSAKMAHMPTMKQRLELAVKQAEERLAQAKRARELFDKHPDLEELINLLQRGNF